jgi:L-seryl-tRNA(Ser) seleniumtransferase
MLCRSGVVRPEEVADAAVGAVPEVATSLRRVLNATGVIVHTNLGRAPLSAAAVRAMVTAAGTTNLELDLRSGRRGSRGSGVLEELARLLPPGTGAHIVNNGAAALALVSCGLAAGREVVIARGEMVEIGDGFRIPELVESVGATLVEVGATNRVTMDDYARAIGPRTAMMLKVHPSNFQMAGFVAPVSVAELTDLPVPVVVDIGSGLLHPHPRLANEPDATTTLRAGASLVTASGDKLLGGPQCGLIFGKKDLVARLRRHPLARALRVDKLTLAALEATLAGPPSPVAVALSASVGDLERRARRITVAIAEQIPDADVVSSQAVIGGGGAPGVSLPSAAVALPTELAKGLRLGDPAVLGRTTAGRLLLDLTTIDPSADESLIRAIQQAGLKHDLPSVQLDTR